VFTMNQNQCSAWAGKCNRFKRLKHSIAKPKAFTEKGLYMLATILKSKQAVSLTRR